MQPWPQQAPPPRPRRNPAFLLAVPAALVVLIVAAAAVYLATSGSGEQDEIRKTVKDFAGAVDRNDNATVLSMLCPQEAAGVADDIDSPGDHGNPKAEPIPITVEDIKITDDVAEVRVTRPRQQPAKLYLRKEDKVWKLCDPERYAR